MDTIGLYYYLYSFCYSMQLLLPLHQMYRMKKLKSVLIDKHFMHTAIQTINFAVFVIKTVTIKLYSLVAESSR